MTARIPAVNGEVLRLNIDNRPGTAEWVTGEATIAVAPGYKMGTDADWGVQLTHGEKPQSSSSGARREPIYRGETFEQALAGATAFMRAVTPHTYDGDPFDHTVLGRVEQQEHDSTDFEVGDWIEYHHTVTKVNISDGSKDGEYVDTDNTYRGEVVDVHDDKLAVRRFTSFGSARGRRTKTGITDSVAADQISARIV